jgi:hypothetical protein
MMLRQIVPLSLAMTACATFISTNVDAATFTFTILPVGSLQRNPGDTIEFNVIIDQSALNTKQSVLIDKVIFPPLFDDKELAFNSLLSRTVSNYTATTTEVIASLFFTVRPGVVKDGTTDLTQVNVSYSFTDPKLGVVGATTYVSNRETILDVEPVPEPLTMLGAAAALGYGAILKRKYSKNTEF